jgi:hypothetical protein
MKLVDLIDYLLNPKNIEQLYDEQKLNPESESIEIYMRGFLNVDSEIKLFEMEETSGHINYEKDGVKYIALLPIDLAIDLIESDLDLKGHGYSNQQIAQRLVEYGINDA